MTWVIGGTTLPVDPSRITIQYAASIREIDIPAVKAWVIGWGKKSDKLKIEGTIVQAGQTAAQLYTTYLSPYLNMVNTLITINATDSRYDGDWVLTSFKWNEVGGFTTSFRFTMEFIRGSQHIML